MVWILGLDQHFSGTFGAPSAPGYLHDRLSKPLARSEVGAEQALVGVQYDYQCDGRKIVPLGAQRCGDGNAGFGVPGALEQRCGLALAPDAVAVDARERRVGELLAQRLFGALRPLADRFCGGLAVRTLSDG